jgi:hypothetical protein
MDILQYVTNPMGKGASILNNTEIKNSLNNQFELIKDRIKYIWYDRGNSYICHIMIPSKSLTELKYDVILDFDKSSLTNNDTSINNAIMKVFSNCPSFVFTYAYAFNKQNGLCDWLKNKYNKKVLDKEPVERNRYNIISYEKSIYLACKFILSNSNNKLVNIKNKAIPLTNYFHISNLIATDEQILERYKILKVKEKEEKEKKNPPSSNTIIKKPKVTTSNSKISNVVKKTKTTAVTKTTKKVRKI